MHRTSRAKPRVFTGIALASALCLPAAAIAAQFDFYIKLPPIEGDSGKGAGHGGEIEIQSWSWGASQTSHAGVAGKAKTAAATAVSHDLRTNVIARTSVPPAAGKVSKVDALTIKQGVSATAKGEKGGTEDINIGVGELQEAGEAEITLKGSAAEKLPGKRTPPIVTLKRGAAAEDAASGGVNVAAGDLDGDGRADLAAPRDAASGLPTGKRQHKPLVLAAPLASGSVTVRGKFPSCTVGTRYPSLELGSRAERYKLHGVVITSCGGSDSGEQPMEEISFNYTKIEF